MSEAGKKCAIFTYKIKSTYRKELSWLASDSYSLIILALIGVSEMTTLLLRSWVVVKTEYLESWRKPLLALVFRPPTMPWDVGVRAVGLTFYPLLPI